MAAKDAVTKDYMRNPAVFADAFNFLLYGGRSVINPEKLHDLDTVEIVLPYGEDGTVAPTQKYRDNLKYLTSMEDGQAAYVVLGVEAQSEVSYAMPMRDMLYDAMQYTRQVETASRSHRAEARKRQEGKPVSSGEFLGGFYKTDRLLPVITLVVLFSPEPWDGPMSIHGMLSGVEKEILPFIADYRINLIAPAALDEASMDRFQSSLREVLLFITLSGPLFTEGKYSTDKKQLKRLLDTDTHYQAMDLDAATVINTVTNTKLKLKKKEGKVNMCLAIEEMCRESRLEGEKKGQKKGEKLGEKKGEKRGRQTGIRLINELNGILIERNRIDDLKRAAREPEYQARLIEELLPDSISII